MNQRDGRGPRNPIELWAGAECSVVRLGDSYYDQTERGGHSNRPEDLDLIAGLGIRAVRYPVLWERTAPEGPERADWSWPDARLGKLRGLGIRPIVGLVHHGSGPPSTSLVDPSFADGLASYAAAVARRYPWVEDFTPVNEPLTTARFSGLYGHWYPHGRDARTFALALVNQCRGVALSMRGIREVNPGARLVQTEDLGRTCSSPALAYQADFENERRWLSFDLLGGRVDRGHPLRDYLLRAGIEERELGWFLDNPCPPDILGLNHYLTSDRFLDDRLDSYPGDRHGGNGRDRYADLEAVRICAGGPAGHSSMLREAWGRFHLPLAITEAHLGCTREEQLRWFLEAWEAACAARLDGIDVRAVTAWAIFGSYDWDSLMTRRDGRYEPGAFDLRSPSPRPTALASLLRELARYEEPTHPALGSPGWWRRPERLLHAPSGRALAPAAGTHRAATRAGRGRPILIVGAGALGRGSAMLCEQRGLEHRPLTRQELDITDGEAVNEVLDTLHPWAVINAAGDARVDGAEVMAVACARRGLSLIAFSSDLVFDGGLGGPYLERDAVCPSGVKGRAEAEMEWRILKALPSALLVRTGPLFGPWDDRDFLASALRGLAEGRPIHAEDDPTVSPTYLPDLVHAALDLMVDGERGVWHLANAGAVSPAGLIRRGAELAGLDPSGAEGIPAIPIGLTSRGPRCRALESERGSFLPSLEDALSRFIREGESRWKPLGSPPNIRQIAVTGAELAGPLAAP